MQKQRFLYAAIVTLLLMLMAVSASAQLFTPLHEFGTGQDGAFPAGGLVQDPVGNVYGTTEFGGTSSAGVVYKIDNQGTETILLEFNSTNGGFPGSALIQDQAGNLYGTADEGPGGAGVVFKLSPKGKEKLLHAFQGGLGPRVNLPSGALLMDSAGNLYGTTLNGDKGNCGGLGCGVVYQLDQAGKLKVLYEFTGLSDGGDPLGPLVQDAAGNFYGVTQQGGDLSCPEQLLRGCGTVFKLASNGKLTVLHTFEGGADGAVPAGGLFLDKAGNLYGAAQFGGNSENGLLFKVSGTGKYTVLHRFSGTDGSIPNGSLVSDPEGNLYGTATLGGLGADDGTIFELPAKGRFKVLYNFLGLLDGARPFAGLIRDSAGNLYGTCNQNFLFVQRDGDVFKFTPF